MRPYLKEESLRTYVGSHLAENEEMEEYRQNRLRAECPSGKLARRDFSSVAVFRKGSGV